MQSLPLPSSAILLKDLKTLENLFLFHAIFEYASFRTYCLDSAERDDLRERGLRRDPWVLIRLVTVSGRCMGLYYRKIACMME